MKINSTTPARATAAKSTTEGARANLQTSLSPESTLQHSHTHAQPVNGQGELPCPYSFPQAGQAKGRTLPPKLEARATRLGSGSRRPLPCPHRSVVARPVLTGDPKMLRALRAAEMAAWEAVAPATSPAPRGYLRLPPKPRFDAEAFLWFALASSALVTVLVGVYDISELLDGWSQFAQGIRNLLS